MNISVPDEDEYFPPGSAFACPRCGTSLAGLRAKGRCPRCATSYTGDTAWFKMLPESKPRLVARFAWPLLILLGAIVLYARNASQAMPALWVLFGLAMLFNVPTQIWKLKSRKRPPMRKAGSIETVSRAASATAGSLVLLVLGLALAAVVLLLLVATVLRAIIPPM